MKYYAIKKQDGSFYVIQSELNPKYFLLEQTDVIFKELASYEFEALGDHTLWKDENGDLVIDTAAQTLKQRQAKLVAIRAFREPLLLEADKELFKHYDADASAIGLEADWKTYRAALRAITNSYKDQNDVPTSALDAIDDVEEDITWPTKPS